MSSGSAPIQWKPTLIREIEQASTQVQAEQSRIQELAQQNIPQNSFTEPRELLHRARSLQQAPSKRILDSHLLTLDSALRKARENRSEEAIDDIQSMKEAAKELGEKLDSDESKALTSVEELLTKHSKRVDTLVDQGEQATKSGDMAEAIQGQLDWLGEQDTHPLLVRRATELLEEEQKLITLYPPSAELLASLDTALTDVIDRQTEEIRDGEAPFSTSPETALQLMEVQLDRLRQAKAIAQHATSAAQIRGWESSLSKQIDALKTGGKELETGEAEEILENLQYQRRFLVAVFRKADAPGSPLADLKGEYTEVKETLSNYKKKLEAFKSSTPANHPDATRFDGTYGKLEERLKHMQASRGRNVASVKNRLTQFKKDLAEQEKALEEFQGLRTLEGTFLQKLQGTNQTFGTVVAPPNQQSPQHQQCLKYISNMAKEIHQGYQSLFGPQGRSQTLEDVGEARTKLENFNAELEMLLQVVKLATTPPQQPQAQPLIIKTSGELTHAMLKQQENTHPQDPIAKKNIERLKAAQSSGKSGYPLLQDLAAVAVDMQSRAKYGAEVQKATQEAEALASQAEQAAYLEEDYREATVEPVKAIRSYLKQSPDIANTEDLEKWKTELGELTDKLEEAEKGYLQQQIQEHQELANHFLRKQSQAASIDDIRVEHALDDLRAAVAEATLALTSGSLQDLRRAERKLAQQFSATYVLKDIKGPWTPPVIVESIRQCADDSLNSFLELLTDLHEQGIPIETLGQWVKEALNLQQEAPTGLEDLKNLLGEFWPRMTEAGLQRLEQAIESQFMSSELRTKARQSCAQIRWTLELQTSMRRVLQRSFEAVEQAELPFLIERLILAGGGTVGETGKEGAFILLIREQERRLEALQAKPLSRKGSHEEWSAAALGKAVEQERLRHALHATSHEATQRAASKEKLQAGLQKDLKSYADGELADLIDAVQSLSDQWENLDQDGYQMLSSLREQLPLLQTVLQSNGQLRAALADIASVGKSLSNVKKQLKDLIQQKPNLAGKVDAEKLRFLMEANSDLLKGIQHADQVIKAWEAPTVDLGELPPSLNRLAKQHTLVAIDLLEWKAQAATGFPSWRSPTAKVAEAVAVSPSVSKRALQDRLESLLESLKTYSGKPWDDELGLGCYHLELDSPDFKSHQLGRLKAWIETCKQAKPAPPSVLRTAEAIDLCLDALFGDTNLEERIRDELKTSSLNLIGEAYSVVSALSAKGQVGNDDRQLQAAMIDANSLHEELFAAGSTPTMNELDELHERLEVLRQELRYAHGYDTRPQTLTQRTLDGISSIGNSLLGLFGRN